MIGQIPLISFEFQLYSLHDFVCFQWGAVRDNPYWIGWIDVNAHGLSDSIESGPLIDLHSTIPALLLFLSHFTIYIRK